MLGSTLLGRVRLRRQRLRKARLVSVTFASAFGSLAASRVLLALSLVLASSGAMAHVKWFSREADCAMPPLAPWQVISSPDFLWLGALSFLVMALVAGLDGWSCRPGSPALLLADRLDNKVSPAMPRLVRWGLAGFFCVAVLYFHAAPVYLTPELRATPSWVAPLQLAIAAALLRRSWAWLGALGIVVLYVAAALSYGWFHLLDYPVFLGAAAFVAIDSLAQGRRTSLALAVLRVSAGITLMWAGAEKWLYPWWSADVLNLQLRDVRGSLAPEFFTLAAGFVEFCAAYALVFGRLGSQVAAGLLLVPFIAAIPLFGEVDAIGHAPILVVLAVLTVTRNRLPQWVQGKVGWPAAGLRGAQATVAALAVIGLYGGLQALAYAPG
jgi:uncharacterized membrane protein YphA (DoxX/SURF4 family)